MVIAAAVADEQVRTTGAPFRQVHHDVGAAVAGALAEGRSANAAVEGLISEADRPSSPLEWAHLYEYGGGPGRISTRNALALADRELDTDAAWLSTCLAQWSAADRKRREAVDGLLIRA